MEDGYFERLRLVTEHHLGDGTDERDLLQHVVGDAATGVADDEGVTQPTPRMCAGSTRPSMQVTTTNWCVGIGVSPSWAPVPAKDRLRSRRGFRLDMRPAFSGGVVSDAETSLQN